MSFDDLITFLMVEDLERSHRFYGEVLGLPLVLDQGTCRIYGVAAGAHIGICRRPEAAVLSGTIVTLVTDDVDGWHARLAEAGTTVERPPTISEEFGIHHAFYRDPDGHLLEIQRFLDPKWRSP
jgi:catechol 2,3-dioxygenase-like lactoylglutathione lyase family enzyme